MGTEDDSPRLFAFEEPPPKWGGAGVVSNEGAQAEKFVIPQYIRVPGSSVIRSLFQADSERDAANGEDLGHWSDSKGKRLYRRSVEVEAESWLTG
jgi:hypothetical protein